jgi:hypothetical protein
VSLHGKQTREVPVKEEEDNTKLAFKTLTIRPTNIASKSSIASLLLRFDLGLE